MKWYKHQCTARNSEKLSKVIDVLGLEGYGLYFIILEVVGEKMGADNQCSAEYSLKKWGSFGQVSGKKFLKLAEVMAKLCLFSLERNENLLQINIPNLLKHRDNHTKNLQATCKKVSLELDKESDKELDKELEVEKKNKKRKLDDFQKGIVDDFNRFWSSTPYPTLSSDDKGGMRNIYIRRRLGKGDNGDKIVNPVMTHEDICEACVKYSEIYPAPIDKKTIGMRRFLKYDTAMDWLDGRGKKLNLPAPEMTKAQKTIARVAEMYQDKTEFVNPLQIRD